jgi:hypothetical protein
MGIPRKGSRALEVDGARFRYLIKDGPVTPDPLDREIHLTVQEDAEAPGRVLRVDMPYGHAVGPEVVKQLVRQALVAGWTPSDRGGPFLLESYSLT